ncbi:NF038129 family PEP-CTERM protein [Massilia sp. PAMC28688]|uniref:NF038129 family PEP-CTERM protein n=1 Tax=Massilia sp. PAMC28688 TaxID=2861283 RepID=UPI001C6271F3|nr:NF038129 family PEP-CTERM protein [Massilia sp. PAMC28688]QYF94005.1 NF038129 family PEP-CTERM protein [Massilia sp. PAMC28688]
MFNFKQFAQQALFALAMACGSAAAVAGPTYQVTIDTSSFAGESGLLDFAFSNGFVGTVGATATLSNFSGSFGVEFDRFGSVSGAIPGMVSMTNDVLISYLTQAVTLGGNFGFTVHFGGDFETIDDVNESLFSVALYDADMTAMLAQLVDFTIIPGANGVAASIVISAGDLASVGEVPEPSQLLLMLSALALAGAVMRRRAH